MIPPRYEFDDDNGHTLDEMQHFCDHHYEEVEQNPEQTARKLSCLICGKEIWEDIEESDNIGDIPF